VMIASYMCLIVTSHLHVTIVISDLVVRRDCKLIVAAISTVGRMSARRVANNSITRAA